MGFIKDIVQSIKPTKNDEACFYLLGQILKVRTSKKSFRLTNVTPGLASLLKKNMGGDYIKSQRVFLLNYNFRDTFEEISCNIADLEKMAVEAKRKDI